MGLYVLGATRHDREVNVRKGQVLWLPAEFAMDDATLGWRIEHLGCRVVVV